MASRAFENTFSQTMSNTLFGRTANSFDRTSTANTDTGISMPNPNSSAPISSPVSDGGNQPENTNDIGTRPPSGLCNFHDMEYVITQRYRHNAGCHKNLRTLQQTVGEKKRPCLFDAARIFGGSECSQRVFNGICTFHWSMLNLRVGVCEQYNSHSKTEGSFQHYEMMVDVPIPDRALVPIFPNITSKTSLWDLMFGFSYATNRGLLTTKINEGAAMAYALYYMLDNHCYVEFLARSTYWVQNMTEYLMAFVFYNDELSKDVYASRPSEPDVASGPNVRPSVLKNIFTKNVYEQDQQFDVEYPKIRVPDGMKLSEKDARLVRNLPPLSNNTDTTPSDTRVVSKTSGHRSHSYKGFHIFVSPLILSLRSSSYVNDIFTYAAPPVIGVFNIRFKDAESETRQQGPSHSVFAIQGPIQYGVASSRGNRHLPFANDMPVCTQAYVATLGGVTNVDVNEDRIFASELASYADFVIPDSDKLFSLDHLR